MSRRLEIKNLDSAHEVGPTGSTSAQIYVQAGKLLAQLQGGEVRGIGTITLTEVAG